jgi:hypothetical protein
MKFVCLDDLPHNEVFFLLEDGEIGNPYQKTITDSINLIWATDIITGQHREFSRWIRVLA